MTEHRLKTGMRAWSTDHIKLKFKHYLNRRELPVAPKQFGHVHVSAPDKGWGMLANDQYGDCTIAGIAHGQMVWDWANKRGISEFNDEVIVKQYMQLTGGQDYGLDPIEVAEYWKNTGLEDGSGKRHKVHAYAAITTPTDLIEAAYLFGFAGLGVWLPTNAIDAFVAGHPWDDTSGAPQQNEGHFIPVVGRNSKGNIMVVTWGRLQAVSHAWLSKYFAGGVGYISQEYFNNMDLSPEGFNFAQLNDDLAQLSA